MTKPVLFDYWRSSASYRVRIALAMKGVDYDVAPINLVEGAQREAAYRERNPQGFVPMLEIDGHRLTQSVAIIAYLEATRPQPQLLPGDPADAAHVRTLALTIACDIHPLNNLRVLRHLANPLGHEEPVRDDWVRHWVREGFTALQAMAAPRAGRFLFGDSPGLADILLVPQMYNARRFRLPLDEFPLLVNADAEATRLEPFAAAHPDRFAPAA